MQLLSLLAPLLLASGDGPVVLRAGTVHLVEDGVVLEDGAVYMRDGKIVSAGADLETPAGATEIDYGPDAVIIPGIVAADSTLGDTDASPRTADLGVRAEDNFNPFTSYGSYLRAGVTTAYVAPARGRLIAGQSAVVKLSDKRGESRVVKAGAALHGAITSEARSTPGYWEPPIPATVDVGIGVPQKQLPASTMGAVIALEELMAYAKGGAGADEYGAAVGPALAEWIQASGSWRLAATSVAEIQALLDFASSNEVPLVIDGASDAGELADEIAASGAHVVLKVDTQASLADRGKGPDARWQTTPDAVALAEAGVSFAISNRSATQTLFSAALAAERGLAEADALRAITLSSAQILGVADSVGSIKAGKDGDVVVLNGSPAAATSSVLATWVDGELSWESGSETTYVLEVDELHIGDGEVLAPGQLLISGGKIAEIGRVVARPAGCRVVRGAAAMPGMIDARGHLGLEGSQRSPNSSVGMTRLFEPGDETDRRVAKAGVTTVALTQRSLGNLALATAYKPAASSVGKMLVKDPAVIYLNWASSDPFSAGSAVRQALQKGADYKKSWDEYAKAVAAWRPEPPKDEDEEEEEEEEAEEEEEEEEKKPRKPKPIPPFSLTGVWEGESDGARFRLQINQDGESITGRLRCDSVSKEVVDLTGERVEHGVKMSGLAPEGEVSFEGSTEESNTDGIAFKATTKLGEISLEVSLERTSEEYRVARRPKLEAGEPAAPAPKGYPKRPKFDPIQEPIKAAMEGRGRLMVSVNRSKEILDCVAACNAYGIKPVLVDASGAASVASSIKGKVTGVMPTSPSGAVSLSRSGIPVAFGSKAEEGAAGLHYYVASGVRSGLSPAVAVRSLTSDAAAILGIHDRVGALRPGLDADVLLLDGSPTSLGSSVERVWVAGEEIK